MGVALFAVGISLVWSGFFYAGAAMMGVAQGRCGWLQHEGGHYSLTGNIKTDKGLQIAIYGLGCGMSAAWWRNQHNKHHATPQKLKHDVDLDTLPLVAFNAEIAKKAKHPLLKLWLKYQALVFCPVSCLLVALGWQYAAGHTINVNGGNYFFDLVVDWWMEYLNYQIEHHLFPEMPQFRHPETSKRVKKFFAEHNIKYDQRVYSEACYATWYNLYTVGNEDHAKKE